MTKEERKIYESAITRCADFEMALANQTERCRELEREKKESSTELSALKSEIEEILGDVEEYASKAIIYDSMVKINQEIRESGVTPLFKVNGSMMDVLIEEELVGENASEVDNDNTNEDCEYSESEMLDESLNNGGSTQYYKFPTTSEGFPLITDVDDLANWLQLEPALYNILRAIIRMDRQDHSQEARDRNKIEHYGKLQNKYYKES